MLTDTKIKALPPAEARKEHPDGKIAGLYLVQQPAPSTALSWALRYRAESQPRKLTLGAYPVVGIAAARKRATEALGEVAGGKDPAGQKQASRAAAKAAAQAEDDLVERVVAVFIERYAKVKTRDWRETERMLVKEVTGPWKGKRLSQITRAQVHDLLDTMIDRGAPIGANRVLAQLRKMCRWAVDRGIIDTSPCDGISKPSAETVRDRVLSDDELRRVWIACRAAGYPFGPFAQLLILTGARRDEIADMPWSELDLDARVWRLPAERSKNRQEHAVPLSDSARAIIESLPRVGDRFAFSTNGRSPISGFSKFKADLDKAVLADGGAPVAPWTLHDLRRTTATSMAGLGIAPHVVEAVLNHKSGTIKGVAAVYNKYSYSAEKKHALDAWAAEVEALVSGQEQAKNVVELVARRG
jgi:integrase